VQRIKNLLRWLNVFVIFATFLAYLSPYFSPEQYWGFSIFGLAYPWLLLVNILLLIFWGVLKKRYFFLFLASILMGWGHVSSLLGVNFSSDEKSEKAIKVMTYNAHNFYYLNKVKKKKNRKKIEKELMEWIEKNKSVAIFCMQELGGRSIFFNQLDWPYEHRLTGKTASIYSKFPILNKGSIPFKKSSNSALWADLDLGNNKKVRVYSIHLQSSQIDLKEIDVVAEGKIKEKETWLGLKGMFSKFKNASIIRSRQAEKVMGHVAQSPYPVIVGGDFNETPLSYIYRLFSKKLNNAFQAKGSGIGSTYGGKIPALKIDYIFTDPRIKILDHNIDRVPFSDHYPMTSHLLISE